MYKYLDNIFRVSFCVFFITLLAAIYFLVNGQEVYKQAVIVATFASFVVVVLALYEVISSERSTAINKVLWTVFFVSFNTLAVLVYFITARKKIVGDVKHFSR